VSPASDDQIFRGVLIACSLVVFPVVLYHRIKSQATGEKLDRLQEGLFVFATLRPIGLACMLGLFAYMIDPRWMSWSAMPLPSWLRWAGVVMGLCGGALLVWTLRTLGPNLTDTVVTRRSHTLVTGGPYRWVRHPFYGAVALSILANSVVAANWFLLVTGALTMILLGIRTRTEERKLLERFGDAYRAYRAQTGQFLPKLGAKGRPTA
jgi:protein-S-isoprenylcysteine O-methyltransferase Ste14